MCCCEGTVPAFTPAVPLGQLHLDAGSFALVRWFVGTLVRLFPRLKKRRSTEVYNERCTGALRERVPVRYANVVVRDLAARECFRVGGAKPGNRSRVVSRRQRGLRRLIERQTICEGGLPEERGRRIGLG